MKTTRAYDLEVTQAPSGPNPAERLKQRREARLANAKAKLAEWEGKQRRAKRKVSHYRQLIKRTKKALQANQ